MKKYTDKPFVVGAVLLVALMTVVFCGYMLLDAISNWL